MKQSTIALALILSACGTSTSDKDPDVAPEVETSTVTLTHIGQAFDFIDSGSFSVPDGADDPGPVGPGGSYTFEVYAGPGHWLSLATMFAQSNDLFLAPSPAGIELWPMGSPLTGDVTGEFDYWDAGSEENQEPGVGSDQAPRQAAENTGVSDMDASVRLADDAWNNLPAIADLLEVSVTHLGEDRFSITVANISEAGDLVTSVGTTDAPVTPGVWAVHGEGAGLFAQGEPAPVGLEALAEDGNFGVLDGDVSGRTGLSTPFAPGVWAVVSGDNPLFAVGMVQGDVGLEMLAEDGDPGSLASSVDGAVFDTPAGASEPGPIFPGDSYSFTVEHAPGVSVAFATMLVQSNDLFVGGVIDLDTGAVEYDLYDAGTEVNQHPGTGLDQAPRQMAAGDGAPEMEPVSMVADMFEWPLVGELIEVRVD